MMNRSPRNNEKDSLIINRKQVSRIVSGSLLCSFFIFTAGYFWGKKRAVEELSCSFEQEAFCDQLTLNEQIGSLSSVSPDVVVSNQPFNNETKKDSEITLVDSDSSVNTSRLNEFYQAKLCGFGTIRAAQQLVGRLKNAGIATTIVKRASKPTEKNTGNKKVIYWYQVVSEKYEKQTELITLVDAVKRLEKMHDVQIVKVNNDRNA